MSFSHSHSLSVSWLTLIRKVKQFPDASHWFCPRSNDADTGLYLLEDLQDAPANGPSSGKDEQRLASFHSRRDAALTALKIFAFDGDDAREFQQQMQKALARQMAKCDICTREYHRGRAQLKESLEEVYELEEVETFLKRLDDMNLSRIQSGLQEATQTLRSVPQEQRGIRILQPTALYAIFETLNCPTALADEAFLAQFFDEPFKLVQEKRRLKLTTYTPAMTYFLFQQDEERRSWAKASWSKFKRNISATEFTWTVRPPLFSAMSRVQLACLDREFMPVFWAGIRLICDRLDSDLITHSLRAEMGGYDVCKLALDHLQVDSPSFRDMMATINRILRLSPKDFWEAISVSSPIVWVQQFKNSPALFGLLSSASAETSKQLLDSLFQWTGPFISSQRPTNQAASCHALLEMLFEDLQRDRYSSIVRTQCYMAGLQALTSALETLQTDEISAIQRAAITDVLDLVDKHAHQLVMLSTRSASVLFQPSAEVLRLALAIECQCLMSDQGLLADQRSLHQDKCSFHLNVWKEIVKSTKHDNINLICHALAGCKSLVGIEKFVIKQKSERTMTLEHFNQTHDAIHGYLSDILQRASEFDASDAAKLVEGAANTHSCFMQLSSSDAGVRAATVELLKTASSSDVRSEALQHFMRRGQYSDVLSAYSISLKRMALLRTFAPAPSMLSVCKDLTTILCDSADGIFRQRDLQSAEINATEGFWGAVWTELQTIFVNTEAWSNMGHDKTKMMEFCGNVMEFAGLFFNQSPLFASAIDATSSNPSGKISGAGKRLTEDPKTTLPPMLKFLRLRDPFLLSKSTDLVCEMLKRLKQFETAIDEHALKGLEDMLNGMTRTVLNMNQKAELQRALETHIGRSIKIETEPQAPKQASSKPAMKTGAIDFDKWRNKTEASPQPATMEATVASASSASDAFKARQAAAAAAKKLPSKLPNKPVVSTVGGKPTIDAAEFGRQRRAEMEAKKKRDAEAAAKVRRGYAANGVDAATAGQGSGIAGIGGVFGKDHTAPRGEGMMVSSDEESEESETELDRELFGGPVQKKSSDQIRKTKDEIQRRKAAAKPQGPVKKQRVVRSAKDMRARLAPDLAPLHKLLLSWDFNHDGPLPPNSTAKEYASVLARFRDPVDYQSTFQPLLTLEAWNGFLKAKDESTAKSIGVKITSRSNVDDFLEIGASVDMKFSKEMVDGDLVLLSLEPVSEGKMLHEHCFARIQRTKRQKTHMEFLLRIVPGSLMASKLKPAAEVQGMKIMSLVPLEREYGALLGLQYYDLCEEITSARPSPLLNYNDERLKPYMNNYSLNKAQAKAIRSALDNDAFTLIQGPPGSGKTKTIVAIVGALLTEALRSPAAVAVPRSEFIAQRPPSKKLLVCAPSNAAVDELVMRFKEGVKITSGESRKLGVVRLGRSDAMNANVKDVTLDYLVDKKLNITSEASQKEKTQKLMGEHKQISARLRDARAALDSEDTAANRQAVQDLVKSKQSFGRMIDTAKDDEDMQSRRADLNRRKAQQDVIEEAHVVCATLSGSGHDMFQSLNVEFETVVIDEAAQCVELSALIPLKYGCAKCVLVGDPQQLPPTVFSREAANYKYEQSLFVRMQANHPEHVHLLDTQYRMHPAISAFPAQTFYQGRLQDGAGMAKLRTRAWHAADLLGPYQFFDVQGKQQTGQRGHSLVNHAEIKVAMQLYMRLTTDFKQDFAGKIGVITPYKSQLRELREQFSRQYGQEILTAIEFNTTDAFQGRESEIIIFSCVRAHPDKGIGFLQDIRRMNVGLTRAKSSLWVLGNSQSLEKGEFWRKLLAHSRSSGSFFQGDINAVLSKPMKRTRKLEDMPDPSGQKTKPPPPQEDSGDSMDIDGADSAPSKPSAPTIKLEDTKPHTEPTVSKQEPPSTIPAKRQLADSRRSSSASASSSSSHTDSDPDVKMEDAPPTKKQHTDPDVKPAAPESKDVPMHDKKPRTHVVPAAHNKPAGDKPPPKAIVRRKGGSSIFAKDPTRRGR